MTTKAIRARRALHKERRELAAFYQGQLSMLETVRAQGLSVLSLMIAVSAVLLSASRLPPAQAQFVVFVAALSAVGMVVLFIRSAERRALEIEQNYLQAHSELFGRVPAIELVSWLLSRRRRFAKRRAPWPVGRPPTTAEPQEQEGPGRGVTSSGRGRMSRAHAGLEKPAHAPARPEPAANDSTH